MPCQIIVQHISDYYIKLRFKPYYGMAGSFLSPRHCFAIDTRQLGEQHQDWFDENAADIRSLVHDVNAAHDALLHSPTSRTFHERFFSMRATVQRKLRWMEINWWSRKAAQSYADISDINNINEARNGVYGPSRLSLHPVKSTDSVWIRNKEFIFARWTEYPQNLLNKVHTTDAGILNDLPTMQIIPKLDDPLAFDEVEKAILNLKDNKTAVPENIPAEVVVVISPHQSPRCGVC